MDGMGSTWRNGSRKRPDRRLTLYARRSAFQDSTERRAYPLISKEFCVSHGIKKFTNQMQAKMKQVEDGLESLMAATQTQAKHADKAVRAHIETLEADATKAKESLKRARTEMASWVEDAKETVVGWKDKLDTSMLHARADRAERYAEAALVVALASVDQAEKAMLSAGLARSDAESVKKAA
jgi:ElaB/YqjD/DUF883 family membrane-anchored ribosome-binding protein